MEREGELGLRLTRLNAFIYFIILCTLSCFCVQRTEANMTLDLVYSPVSIGKLRLWLIFASTLDNMGALGKVWQ